MSTVAHPAPLVTDTAMYDAAHMERARLKRYADRLAATLSGSDDPDAADDCLVRKLMEGRAIQDRVRHRPIPKHRALIRLDDLPKAATRARAASDSPR